MRFCFRAIQAVTVELLGVLAVVWMLFGFAAFGIGGTTHQPPTFGAEIEQTISIWQAQITNQLLPSQTPASLADKRERYVADRLSHYSRQMIGSSRR